jgi:hypothetical protein
MAVSRFGSVYVLINNAGLTFTTIDPARFRRAERKFFNPRCAGFGETGRPVGSRE